MCTFGILNFQVIRILFFGTLYTRITHTVHKNILQCCLPLLTTDGRKLKDSYTPPRPSSPESPNLLEILGENISTDNTHDLSLNEELAQRWIEWRDNGVKTDDIKELLDKYKRDAEICYLEAPILNPVLKGMLIKTARRRDEYFVKTQNKVGSGLVALSNALNLLLTDNEEEVDVNQLLRYLWDSSKLLVEAHHQISVSRRAYIVPVVDEKYETALKDSKTDKYLFGEKFNETIRDAQACDKLAKELLPKQNKSENKIPLNAKGPFGKNQSYGRGTFRHRGSLKTFKVFHKQNHHRQIQQTFRKQQGNNRSRPSEKSRKDRK